MRDTAQLVQLHRQGLQSKHSEYTERISSKEMAVSLETASFLASLCDTTTPLRILDLGSGFSSYTLACYASSQATSVTLVSVDDSPTWLDRTRSFLKSEGVASTQYFDWDAFAATDMKDFDLIFHDLGNMDLRLASLENVIARLKRPRGLLILDDVHKEKYLRTASEILNNNHLRFHFLDKLTTDELGRLSAIAWDVNRN